MARWTALFKPCLKYAVDMGFDIAFTPHLDDGLNNGQWRNAMRINPVERYGGMSYFDVVLGPLADAMAATLLPNTRVGGRPLGGGPGGGSEWDRPPLGARGVRGAGPGGWAGYWGAGGRRAGAARGLLFLQAAGAHRGPLAPPLAPGVVRPAG